MATAVKERRPIRGLEAVAEAPDGKRVPFIPFPTPIFNAAGKFVGAVNMLVDITDRKRAERATQQLAAIIESSDDAIVAKDLDGIITSWNPGAELLFGYKADIPADHLDEEPAILQRIRSGDRVRPYETVRKRKDGSLIDISLTVSPIRDTVGRVVGASKIARDITERKRIEQQTAILAREAEHRARNILATVAATVQLSRSDTAEGLKKAIEGRIQALANVHTLFVQSRWAGADLQTLTAHELLPYCQDGEIRTQIVGPNVLLEPTTAQAIAVILHELSTNAAKYGALSSPHGRVRVTWSHSESGQVVVYWTEKGGPPVEPPTRNRFGTRVMENMIRQVDGSIHFDWGWGGLACEITLPT